MKDVQNRHDDRGIDIQKVGVKNVHLPLQMATKEGGYQNVLGKVSLSVSLPMQFKGTHMSRFMEILLPWSTKPISNNEVKSILANTCEVLNSDSAEISIKFKYFIYKSAPVSGKKSVLDYDCEFSGFIKNGKFVFTLGVEVPVTSCCPCSKEISDYGAHNQRAVIRCKVRFNSKGFLWIEDLVKMLEEQGSCEIYPLLKREDEKFVTQSAYDNAKFVEDILRDCVISMRNSEVIKWFDLECESFESIHNHSAFACHIEDKRMI